MADQWQAFVLENPSFAELYFNLFRFTSQLAIETAVADGDSAGAVICELLLACMQDADDILLLSSKDRHWGALKLLRGLFERTVTAKYIGKNPSEADAFIAFDAIDWQVVATGIEKHYGLGMKAQSRRNLDEAAKAARQRFRQEPCSTCGLRKQTSWTTRSSLELSKIAALDSWHFEAFTLPSKYLHPTFFGVENMFGNEAGPLHNTLKITHVLTIEAAITHQRYFRGDPLASIEIVDAIRSFLNIWTFSETDFGLGVDAGRAGLCFIEHPLPGICAKEVDPTL